MVGRRRSDADAAGAKAEATKKDAVKKALRLHGSIAREIGTRIVAGRYRPGDVLDGEVYASGQRKVSRAAYREAMRILSAKGLVESRPKWGTRVTRRAEWHMLDPDVLSWLFDVEPDEGLLASLFELRKIVEPQAAALAALRRTDLHVEILATSLAAMRKHSLSVKAGQVADQEFHAALLEATGNAFLMSLTQSVTSAVSWTTIFKQRSAPPLRDALPDHERVFLAVEKQDHAAAHEAMTDLIELAFKDTTAARRALRANR